MLLTVSTCANLTQLIAESVIAFAWEPIGHKFAFIHGETPRISVSFYIVKKGGAVEIVSKYMQTNYYRNNTVVSSNHFLREFVKLKPKDLN